jgi:perosamine synthetase
MNAGPSQFRMSKDPVFDFRFLHNNTNAFDFPGRQSNSGRYVFSQARYAIYHGLKALRLAPGDVVLLPSYLCSAAISPVLACGAKVEFYEIDTACQPDFADLQRRIRPETKAILAVHYFGMPCDIARFRELCDRYHLFLIEDCAHVLQGEFGGKALGTFGDLSLFSWRKFLPLYDGGELVWNGPGNIAIAWEKERWLFTLKAAKNLVEQKAEYGDGAMLKTTVGFFEALGRGKIRIKGKEGAEVSSPSGDLIGLEFDKSQVNVPMSRISRWIFKRSDLARIISTRRENYLFLVRLLSSIPDTHLIFPNLGAGQAPWVLPIIFKGIEHAHIALRSRGIPAVTWGGVRHPSLPLGTFGDAEFLYENLVMLPVHQNLTEKDLQVIVDGCRSVCGASTRNVSGDCSASQNRPAMGRTSV